MVHYTEEFKLKCKALYPNWERLHKALDTGSVWVGRYLDDSSSGMVSAEAILAATSLEEIQAVARVEKAKRDLYAEWLKISNEF